MVRSAKTATINSSYIDKGVYISPSAPSAGDKVKIVYDGLLAKCGATDVFAHVGFGSKWENIYDYRMQKTSTGFEVTVPVLKTDTLNVAFKDCANNWDNNSGNNYSFQLTS